MKNTLVSQEDSLVQDTDFYVVDDDSNEILAGPLSEESAENFADEHVNCHVVYKPRY